jgi:hypothetical protein
MSEGTERHRWFQFSLRWLLVAVTLLGVLSGWLAWNLNSVRERDFLRRSLTAHRVWVEHFDRPSGKLPLAWRLLGAEPELFNSVLLPDGEFTEQEINRLIAHFPEVTLWRTDQHTILDSK